MSLDNNQLLLLDNLIYLDTTIGPDVETVKDVVDELLRGAIEQDKIYTDAAGKTSDMCLMSKEEWTSVLTAIKNDDELCGLKIIQRQAYFYLFWNKNTHKRLFVFLFQKTLIK